MALRGLATWQILVFAGCAGVRAGARPQATAAAAVFGGGRPTCVGVAAALAFCVLSVMLINGLSYLEMPARKQKKSKFPVQSGDGHFEFKGHASRGPASAASGGNESELHDSAGQPVDARNISGDFVAQRQAGLTRLVDSGHMSLHCAADTCHSDYQCGQSALS